jgi:hypothetical protein
MTKPDGIMPGKVADRMLARQLLIKAARRLRRENLNASDLWLWPSIRDRSWMEKPQLPWSMTIRPFCRD